MIATSAAQVSAPSPATTPCPTFRAATAGGSSLPRSRGSCLRPVHAARGALRRPQPERLDSPRWPTSTPPRGSTAGSGRARRKRIPCACVALGVYGLYVLLS